MIGIVVSTKRLMAAWRSTSEWNTPRLSRCWVSLAKKVSTAFSYEHEVGVKWNTSADAGQPVEHLGMLVGGVVVKDGVDHPAGGHGPLDRP